MLNAGGATQGSRGVAAGLRRGRINLPERWVRVPPGPSKELRSRVEALETDRRASIRRGAKGELTGELGQAGIVIRQAGRRTREG